MAPQQKLNVKMVLTHEDIASGPKDQKEERRGLVGFVPVYKVAGAAAEEGLPLDSIVAIAERMSENMRVLSVAAHTATHPSTGLELSPLGDDEMEIGAGQ